MRPPRATKTSTAINLLFDVSDVEPADDESEAGEEVDDENVASDVDVASSRSDDNDEADTPAATVDHSSEEDGAPVYRWRQHIRPINVSVPDDCFSDPPEENLTPLNYFNMFLADDMIKSLTVETNRYAVEKTGSCINVTELDMRRYIAITMLMGIVKLPRYRMYWTPAYRVAPVADCMGLNRFETIKRFFHINNNLHQLIFYFIELGL